MKIYLKITRKLYLPHDNELEQEQSLTHCGLVMPYGIIEQGQHKFEN